MTRIDGRASRLTPGDQMRLVEKQAITFNAFRNPQTPRGSERTAYGWNGQAVNSSGQRKPQ